MVARLLTAVVGLPILVVLIWAGGLWTRGLVAIVAALAAWELAQMARAWGQNPHPAVVAPLAALLTSPWLASELLNNSAVVVLLAALLAVLAAVALLPTRDRDGTVSATLPTVAIALYSGTTLLHVSGITVLTEGRDWVFLLIGIVFAADTAAFGVGRLIGRHRLAPSISPAKTWEGAIGGLVGAAAASVGVSVGLDLPVAPLEGAIGGLVLGAVSQVGDLYISSLKRAAGFKDSGSLLPGHGGILDRVDSIMWAGVGVFWWAWFTVG